MTTRQLTLPAAKLQSEKDFTTWVNALSITWSVSYTDALADVCKYATEYARNYAGSFPFMVKRRKDAQSLPAGQYFRGLEMVRSIINCWRADEAVGGPRGRRPQGNNKGARVTIPSDLNLHDIKPGRVPFSGKGVVLYIERPTSGKWAGWTFVKGHNDPDTVVSKTFNLPSFATQHPDSPTCRIHTDQWVDHGTIHDMLIVAGANVVAVPSNGVVAAAPVTVEVEEPKTLEGVKLVVPATEPKVDRKRPKGTPPKPVPSAPPGETVLERARRLARERG